MDDDADDDDYDDDFWIHLTKSQDIIQKSLNNLVKDLITSFVKIMSQTR